VTTHTLFCLRAPMPVAAQRVLCALLNSYAANYLIRHRVNTHVTASLVSRLPVPLLGPSHPLFARMATLSAALEDGAGPVEDMDEHAELQAIVAGRYGLSADDFSHILSTFPLVPAATRQRALDRFGALRGSRTTETRRHGRSIALRR
jgi:hypothetical protein